MRTAELVFWLDVLATEPADGVGVLCRRHADSMVVPRQWTLDDLRDPDLHLFRPPSARTTPPARRPRRASAAGSEQLELTSSDAAVSPNVVADGVPTEMDASQGGGAETAPPPVVSDAAAAESGSDELDETVALEWTPEFDVADDLDGLLDAQSPLLARAFRGDDRPR